MHHNHKQHGSILPVVLVILSIISLLIIGVISLMTEQTDTIKRRQTELMALTELHNTFEILQYSLLTRPYNYAGMVTDLSITRTDNPFLPLPPISGTEIHFDNTLYAGWGRGCFAIQNADSLLNLNYIPDKRLNQLLIQLEIAAEQREVLISQLNQYKQFVPPITTQNPLTSLTQLSRLPAWEDSGLLEDRRFYDAVTTAGRNLFNINSSPGLVLQTYTGFSDETITQLIAARPFTSELPLYRMTTPNFPVPVENIKYMASDYFRIRLYHPNLSYYKELLISFSLKEEDGQPWLIESTLRLPATGAPDLDTARETGLAFFDPAHLEFDD